MWRMLRFGATLSELFPTQILTTVLAAWAALVFCPAAYAADSFYTTSGAAQAACKAKYPGTANNSPWLCSDVRTVTDTRCNPNQGFLADRYQGLDNTNWPNEPTVIDQYFSCFGGTCPSGYTQDGTSCIPTPPPPPPSTPDPGKNGGGCPTSNPDADQGLRTNPCNAATGNKYQSETDFRPGDGVPAFTRSYNSQLGSDLTSGLGWTALSLKRLEINDTTVKIREGDGRSEPFTCTSTTGVCTGDADTHALLTKDASGYTLARRTGSLERYDTNGRLVAETRSNGQTTDYGYNASNELASVTGPFGHVQAFSYSGGHIASMTTPKGEVYGYTYDANNNLSRVDYPGGQARIYHYEDPNFPHHLTGISNVEADGTTARFATYAYDANGKAILSEHAGGIEHYGLQYDSDTQTTVTDAAGTREVMTFNDNLGLKTLTQVVNQSDGKSHTQTFDTQNNLTCKKDEEGHVTTYTYGATNQKTSMTEGLGGDCTAPTSTSATRTTTYQYVSPTLDLPTVTQSPSVNAGASKTVTISYGDGAHPNLPTQITQSGFTPSGAAVSRAVSMGYNANGQVASINGRRTDVNDVTTFAYYNCTTGGACGQLQSVTNALGQVTTYDSYDANGRLLRQTDPNGVRTNYAYDLRGRVLSMTVTPPTGTPRVTQYTYDAAGKVTSIAFPDGMILSYTYDAAEKLRQVLDNVGDKITYDYDARGNRTQTSTYDPDGTLVRQVTTAYDIRNRIAQINNGGSITQEVNDAVGNLTQETDPNQTAAGGGIHTTHGYDALNRLIQTINNLSSVTTYGYNVADRLTQVQAPNNATTQYQYDDLGDLLQEVSPDRGTTRYAYDEAGNLKTMTDARGVVTSYTYDALNRVTAIDYPRTSEDVALTYDGGTSPACTFGIGRLCQVVDESGTTSYAYDGFGNIVQRHQTILGVDYLTQFAYDALDRLTALTYPDGATLTYSRDAVGRISAVAATVNGQTTVLATGITYRADGLVTGRTFGNGLVESRLYDTQGRLGNQFIGSADTRVYAYDANSNLVGLQSLPQVSTYGYDALDRLTQDAFITGTFDYDPNGNRVQADVGAASTTYAYAPNSNRLQQQTGADARNYAYDANGNITNDGSHAYSYDARNYLTDIDSTDIYRYNAQAQRVVKTVGAQTTVYLYDLTGHLLLEADASGSIQRRYVYMNDEPLAILLPGGATSVDQVIDNTASGVQVAGDWPSSTVVAGFEGTDYQVHSANGAPPGGLVIDNGTAGFSATGDWPTSTVVAGFEGADYEVHGANGAPPGGLVVDNSDGTAVAGTWPTSTSVAGFVGANYQAHAAGSGTAVFRWSLGAATPGDYQVYAQWSAYANRATDAKYTVHYSGGQTTVAVNQQTNGGTMNLLGTFPLDGSSYIELSDDADGYVIADAVKAVPVGAAPNTATWTPSIPADGNYRVYAKWTAYPNRATDAKYTVFYAGDSSTVTVNQQIKGGEWNLLGTFAFTAGGGQRIELTDQADGYVIADAVKLVPEGAAPNSVHWPLNPPQAGAYQVFAKWTAYPNRATDAKYTVHYSGGQTTVTVNQQTNGGTWNLLGTFNLDAASYVELTDQANGYVIADAVRIVGTGTGGTPQTLYVHTDHEGTPRLATNAAGTVVWRWGGAAFGDTAPNEDPDGDGIPTTISLRFAGQYADGESGLYYNWNRYYDPRTGRYLSSDPIGLRGGLNTYTYVENNPLTSVDPNGLLGYRPPGPDQRRGGIPGYGLPGIPGPFGPVCGPEGQTLATWLPDAHFGADFTDACHKHDKCYSCSGRSRKDCDNEFCRSLLQSCQAQYRARFGRQECDRMARFYCKEVRERGEQYYEQ